MHVGCSHHPTTSSLLFHMHNAAARCSFLLHKRGSVPSDVNRTLDSPPHTRVVFLKAHKMLLFRGWDGGSVLCVGVTAASSFWCLQQLFVYLRVPNLLCGLVFKSQTQWGGVCFPFFFSVQARREEGAFNVPILPVPRCHPAVTHSKVQ